MTRHNRGLWLTAAATIAFAISCGPPGTPDAGPGTCTTDAACGTGKGCHPILKTCVATCTGASDCPSNEKTCAKINASTPSFCTCSTNELCAASTAGNICNSGTKKCSAKCTASSCPSGLTCDTASGNCGGGTTDAGTPDAGTPCTGLGTCTYPAVCDFTASVCKPGATCNMSGVQPDTCGYAGYCTGNSNCAQVEAATCPNFGAGGLTPVFNPRTSTGPIIYYISADPTPPPASCFRGFFTHSFLIDAYRATDWPAQLMAIPGGWYVTTTGIKDDITAGLPPSYYTPTGKTMRLRKYLCAKQSAALSAGFYFTGGNEACATSSGGVAGTAACTTNAQCGTGSVCNVTTGICG